MYSVQWNNVCVGITDGKFILELARAREGERVGWVSVPRKTFWPPTPSGPTPAPATPSTPSTHSTLSALSTLSARQERATSLSGKISLASLVFLQQTVTHATVSFSFRSIAV